MASLNDLEENDEPEPDTLNGCKGQLTWGLGPGSSKSAVAFSHWQQSTEHRSLGSGRLKAQRKPAASEWPTVSPVRRWGKQRDNDVWSKGLLDGRTATKEVMMISGGVQ